MTSLSDKELDSQIDHCEKIAGALRELKARRESSSRAKKHLLIDFQILDRGKNAGKIWYTRCQCGEETRHKVPLSSAKEFECPKMLQERRKRGKV